MRTVCLYDNVEYVRYDNCGFKIYGEYEFEHDGLKITLIRINIRYINILYFF